MSKVHINYHNSKLGASIPSVNLPAGITCRPDAPCYRLCYGRRGRFVFTQNKNLAEGNLEVWNNDPKAYEIAVTAAAYPAKFFRWHSTGDIPDMEYLKMMVRVAQKCDTTTFLCFTKKFELVNEYMDSHDLPGNLRPVLSAWGSWIPDNPHNLPMAYVALKREVCNLPEHAFMCMGSCATCVSTGCSCWHLQRGQSVVMKQH